MNNKTISHTLSITPLGGIDAEIANAITSKDLIGISLLAQKRTLSENTLSPLRFRDDGYYFAGPMHIDRQVHSVAKLRGPASQRVISFPAIGLMFQTPSTKSMADSNDFRINGSQWRIKFSDDMESVELVRSSL